MPNVSCSSTPLAFTYFAYALYMPYPIPPSPSPNQTVPNPCFRLLVFFYGVWGAKVKGKGLCSTLQSPQSKGERATPVHPLGKNIPSPPASSSDQALNQRKRRRRGDLNQTTLVPYLYRVSHNTYQSIVYQPLQLSLTNRQRKIEQAKSKFYLYPYSFCITLKINYIAIAHDLNSGISCFHCHSVLTV